MSVLNEGRFLELLNFPIMERCQQLSFLFDEPSIPTRDLQEMFPTLVNSIFGNNGLGWGLRIFVDFVQPVVSQTLYNFFCSTGPMMRLCYRLVNERVGNEPVKFEFNLNNLPKKLSIDLQTGHYSPFYSELLNVDPFRRQVTTLSLNAFEYFMIHFIIHATVPLHKLYPTALQVHNDRLKTVYFHLCGHYVEVFLPGNPDSIVHPFVCSNVKAPQQIPVQTLPQRRSPKYLKLPNTQHSLYGEEPSPTVDAASLTASTTSSFAWRTESVLNFFIDIWLRFDIEEARDLPSSEFIRCVRFLVKHAHCFANSAPMDQSAMVSLRKSAQPMMKARIYPFLKSVLDRWPIDSSLSVVLDLWLSYLQPWRYVFKNAPSAPVSGPVPIPERFDSYVTENLYIYTQLFIYILPRLERLDYSSSKNIAVLQRIVKLFFFSPLQEKLERAERLQLKNAASSAYDSPQRRAMGILRRHGSDEHFDAAQWDKTQFYHEDMYTPLFGVKTQSDVAHFVKILHSAAEFTRNEVSALKREREQYVSQNRILQLISYVYKFKTPQDDKLEEMQRMPEALNWIVQALCASFNLSVPVRENPNETSQNQMQNLSFSLNYSSSSEDLLNVSRQVLQMERQNIPTNWPRIDPALAPIQSNECATLVRFLHQCSSKLNEMLQTELPALYERTDIWGRIAREVLYPPITVQWFDKPRGVKELCEQHLPPRIILRSMASYQTLMFIATSLVFGEFFYSAPTCGLFILLLLFIINIFVRSLF